VSGAGLVGLVGRAGGVCLHLYGCCIKSCGNIYDASFNTLCYHHNNQNTRGLSDEAQHLRQIIREDKEASYAATRTADPAAATASPAANNLDYSNYNSVSSAVWSSPLGASPATLPHDELLRRAEATLAALKKERRRNAELVHRLQQLHTEQVDVIELQRRYTDLQEAHVAQAEMLVEHESLAADAALLKDTVRALVGCAAGVSVRLSGCSAALIPCISHQRHPATSPSLIRASTG